MSQTADFQDGDDQENRGMLVMVFRIEDARESKKLSDVEYLGMKSNRLV